MRDFTNIQQVSSLPIQYMGFIFYEKSPRFVVKTIKNALPTSIKKVGVFVNADIADVVDKVDNFQLDIVQLHGKETPQYISHLKSALPNIGIWKAFSVDENFDFKTTEAYTNLADIFLFDTKTPQYGGAGVKFDWQILEHYQGNTPFMLAGGITENDVEPILKLKSRIPQLHGLDLNSKFEIEPALKDVEKLKRFLDKIQ